jgi:Ser-tRNA(Ala) deacylase AlaX
MEAQNFPATIKDYYNDSYSFRSTGTILQVRLNPSLPLKAAILLDRTIFHPQGGGQPSDKGYIESTAPKNGKTLKFIVRDLTYERETDTIWHEGEYEEDYGAVLEANDHVNLVVDEATRRFNARLHSAGHLIDMAVAKLNLDWSPGKGYHFPDSPYVEYSGKPVDDLNGLAKKLEEICNTYIKENIDNDKMIAKVYAYEDAKREITVPEYIPEGKPFRYVKLMGDDKGCPCGGTHVKSIQDISGVEITKVAKKGKNIRVAYTVKP